MPGCQYIDTSKPGVEVSCDNCRRFIHGKCMNHWRLMSDCQRGKGTVKFPQTLFQCPCCKENYFSYQEREMCPECVKENDTFSLLEGMNELKISK